MCGELAGEPLAIPILLGLELDEFSMNPPMIPLAKQIIRNLDSNEMKKIADAALELESPADIQAFIKEEIPFIAEIAG
jgi:phosphoenolpyruvate-protein kinase (PTS system EI component)